MEFSTINIGIAFLAGFFTFFAGCLAPILPVYISYLAGTVPTSKTYKKKQFLTNSLIFTGGFTGVFFLLSLFIRSISVFLAPYQHTLTLLVGVVLIVFGIHMLGVYSIPGLNSTKRLGKSSHAKSKIGALTLGVLFGFSWTPCIGPVLATILFWTTSQESYMYGLVLLIVFSIGLGLPFILVGILFDQLYPRIKQINTHAPLIRKVTGGLLIVFGILLLTGWYAHVTSFALHTLGSGAYVLEFN